MPGPIDWDALVIGPTFGVFAEPCTYMPAVGAPFAITGVFDREYQSLDLDQAGVASATRKPVLGVQLSQFATAPKPNDKVSIASVGITYVVRNVEPDGHGHAVLELNFVSSP